MYIGNWLERSERYWPENIAVVDVAKGETGRFTYRQLNLRTIETMMQTLGQPIEKTHWIMDKWGYTGSPCVVMALDDAIAQGRGPKPGQTICFCASGGGITMAASVWRWK